jgi:hypothetical protein
MVEQSPKPGSPGTDIAPLSIQDAGSGVPRALTLATDLAVGAASQATRVALGVGARGWDAGAAMGRAASVLPGAAGAGRVLRGAVSPLVSDGRQVRAQARSTAEADTRRLLETFVPGVVDTLDIDGLVRRIEIDRLVQQIDIDRLVREIDIDALVRRIDIDALVQRIDIERLVQHIDIDALVQRIDIDTVVGRIDVNGVVQRVDVDAVVEETAMGSIVARSTSGFATDALDAARSQTAGVDTLVSRAVNRVLRRREEELPAGPPLLTEEAALAGEDTEGAAETAEQGPDGERADGSPDE